MQHIHIPAENENAQTIRRSTNSIEYEMYRVFADDGKGGDITRGGAPLLSYEEWLDA